MANTFYSTNESSRNSLTSSLDITSENYIEGTYYIHTPKISELNILNIAYGTKYIRIFVEVKSTLAENWRDLSYVDGVDYNYLELNDAGKMGGSDRESSGVIDRPWGTSPHQDGDYFAASLRDDPKYTATNNITNWIEANRFPLSFENWATTEDALFQYEEIINPTSYDHYVKYKLGNDSIIVKINDRLLVDGVYTKSEILIFISSFNNNGTPVDHRLHYETDTTPKELSHFINNPSNFTMSYKGDVFYVNTIGESPSYSLKFTSSLYVRLTLINAGENDPDSLTFKMNTGVSASGSGDPYITTFTGHKYKLPNAIKNYRCIETYYNNKPIIVNTSICGLSSEEMKELTDTSSTYTTRVPVLNGYFFDKFFMYYDGKYAIFNRKIELVETNIDKITEGISIKYDDDIKYFSCPIQGNSIYTSVYITIHNITVELRRINHPQIINGINISYRGSCDNVKGIFNTFTNPNNFRVKKLTSTKIIRVLVNTKIYNKKVNETWIDV
jgi:hypothetical protein